MLLLFGGCGIWSALRLVPSEGLLRLLGMLPRAALAAMPVAYLILGSSMNDPMVAFVLEGGGGAGSTAAALAKACATYYGASILLAAGLAGSLSALIWWRIERAAPPSPAPQEEVPETEEVLGESEQIPTACSSPARLAAGLPWLLKADRLPPSAMPGRG